MVLFFGIIFADFDVVTTCGGKEMSDSELFFKHLALEIKKLSNAYSLFFDEMENIASKKLNAVASPDADDVEYGLVIKILNRAIIAFKREIKNSLDDYYYMKDLNILRTEHAATHLKNQINILHESFKQVSNSKNIPESLLKSGLGRNFYFHKNIEKLTSETLLEYFEMNYSLLIEDKEK